MVVTLATIIVWNIFSINNEADYNEQLIKMRAEKDLYFKSAKESPVFGDTSFTRLHYYTPDLRFKLKADYRQDSLSGKPFTMRMTDGVDECFVHSGVLTFRIDGTTYQLHAFKSSKEKTNNRMFLPFTDATSGQQTYGGGRYLDVIEKSGSVTLDFNTSYHPYCAYNKQFVCPIPPKENHIPIAIEAGERLF